VVGGCILELTTHATTICAVGSSANLSRGSKKCQNYAQHTVHGSPTRRHHKLPLWGGNARACVGYIRCKHGDSFILSPPPRSTAWGSLYLPLLSLLDWSYSLLPCCLACFIASLSNVQETCKYIHMLAWSYSYIRKCSQA
jgi:hypothetical protein